VARTGDASPRSAARRRAGCARDDVQVLEREFVDVLAAQRGGEPSQFLVARMRSPRLDVVARNPAHSHTRAAVEGHRHTVARVGVCERQPA